MNKVNIIDVKFPVWLRINGKLLEIDNNIEWNNFLQLGYSARMTYHELRKGRFLFKSNIDIFLKILIVLYLYKELRISKIQLKEILGIL